MTSPTTALIVSVVAIAAACALGFLPGPWALLAFAPLLAFVPLVVRDVRAWRRP